MQLVTQSRTELNSVLHHSACWRHINSGKQTKKTTVVTRATHLHKAPAIQTLLTRDICSVRLWPSVEALQHFSRSRLPETEGVWQRSATGRPRSYRDTDPERWRNGRHSWRACPSCSFSWFPLFVQIPNSNQKHLCKRLQPKKPLSYTTLHVLVIIKYVKRLY